VTDVGQHQMWEAQYYPHDRPHTLVTSGGLGTMGFALPAGIGAKIGRPDDEVWVICGDGGFQMTIQELGTLAQEGIGLKVAIINNFHPVLEFLLYKTLFLRRELSPCEGIAINVSKIIRNNVVLYFKIYLPNHFSVEEMLV